MGSVGCLQHERARARRTYTRPGAPHSDHVTPLRYPSRLGPEFAPQISICPNNAWVLMPVYSLGWHARIGMLGGFWE